MVDSIEFRSGDFDSITRLVNAVLSEDERAIEIPNSAHSELRGFFDRMLNSQSENKKYVLSLSTSENDTIYILNFITANLDNYGVFVFFEEPIEGVYLTTGGSAIDFVIESIYKLPNLSREGESEIYSRAVGAATYLEADMEYPDAGVKIERAEVSLDSSDATNE